MLADRRDGPPVDEFEESGERWIWVQKVTEPPYKMSITSIYEWRDECPALGSKTIEIKKVAFAGPGPARDFVRAADLDKIIEFRSEDTPSPDPKDDWISFENAIGMGFNRIFLTKFTDSGDPRRKKPGRAHPKLHRPIKTKQVRVVANGKIRPEVRLWRQDLVDLRTEVKRPNWVTRYEAFCDYGVRSQDIEAHRKPTDAQEVKTYPLLDGEPIKEHLFPVLTKRGRQTELLHFDRMQIERMAEAKAAQAKPTQQARVYVDSEGMRWWPQFEACRLAGIPWGDLIEWRNDPNPEWDGIIIRAKQITSLRLFRTKHGRLTWVYRERDLDAVRRFIEGWPAEPAPAVDLLIEIDKNVKATPVAVVEKLQEAATAAPLARKRGRKPNDESLEIAEAYRRAREATGISRKQYAEEEGIDYPRLVKALNLASQRKRRSAV